MKERKFHCSVGVTGTLQWLEKRKRFRVDLCGKYIGAFKSREEADIVLSDALKQRNVLIHNRHDDRFDDAGDKDWRVRGDILGDLLHAKLLHETRNRECQAGAVQTPNIRR